MDKLKYEYECIAKGYRYIAGVDEVGRGPLAGNVVCAAVIMPMNDIIEGVDDSKKLSQKKREYLSGLIMEIALAYSIAEVSPTTIDDINILQATKLCMRKAVEGLNISPDVVLIDALDLDLSVPVVPIIKGDMLSYTIGCASIIAKEYRDAQMVSAAEQYPQYGFDKHKGYGTKVHIDALKQYGACPIHRRSFIRKIVNE